MDRKILSKRFKERRFSSLLTSWWDKRYLHNFAYQSLDPFVFDSSFVMLKCQRCTVCLQIRNCEDKQKQTFHQMLALTWLPNIIRINSLTKGQNQAILKGHKRVRKELYQTNWSNMKGHISWLSVHLEKHRSQARWSTSYSLALIGRTKATGALPSSLAPTW